MVATETEAVMGLLNGVHPGNLFDSPMPMLHDPTEQDKARWLEAVPKDWHAFRRALGWWFDTEIRRARARESDAKTRTQRIEDTLRALLADLADGNIKFNPVTFTIYWSDDRRGVDGERVPWRSWDRVAVDRAHLVEGSPSLVFDQGSRIVRLSAHLLPTPLADLLRQIVVETGISLGGM